ncbi:response regulator transcription factor [Bifidobacterium lemurum]|nr:response regulator transcription factor [Bifidobacterium lemurum]QOL34009.1 response regulator transcription factor [Bifidobacterium lemurum]
MVERIRVAVADDDGCALMGLMAVLRRRLPRVTLAWSETTGHGAVRRALDPMNDADILLMDMRMGDMSGLMACRAIRSRDGSLPILAVTAFSLAYYARRAAEAGAQGIVGKNDFDGMGAAIGDILHHQAMSVRLDASESVSFDSARRAHLRLAGDMEPTVVDLSAREREIVEQYAQANKPAVIARNLGISAGSVKTYLDRAQNRLGLSSRADLVEYWWQRS